VEKEKCKENWGQVCALGAKRKSGKTNLQVPSNTEQHNKQAKETTTRLQAGAHIEESKSRNRNKSSGSALRETKIRASIGLQQVRKTGRAEHENERKISGVSSTRRNSCHSDRGLSFQTKDEAPRATENARGGRILMRESPAAAEPKTKPAKEEQPRSRAAQARKTTKTSDLEAETGYKKDDTRKSPEIAQLRST
jgi:hypothetical protein